MDKTDSSTLSPALHFSLETIVPKDEWRKDRDRQHARNARSEYASLGTLVSYQHVYDDDAIPTVKSRKRGGGKQNKSRTAKPCVLTGFLNGLRESASTKLKQQIPPFTGHPLKGDKNAVRLLAYGLEQANKADLRVLAGIVTKIGPIAVKELRRIAAIAHPITSVNASNVLRVIDNRHTQVTAESVVKSEQSCAIPNKVRASIVRPKVSANSPPRPPTTKARQSKVHQRAVSSVAKRTQKQRNLISQSTSQRSQTSTLLKMLIGEWKRENTPHTIRFMIDGTFFFGDILAGRFEATSSKELLLKYRHSKKKERWKVSKLAWEKLAFKSQDGAIGVFYRVHSGESSLEGKRH